MLQRVSFGIASILTGSSAAESHFSFHYRGVLDHLPYEIWPRCGTSSKAPYGGPAGMLETALGLAGAAKVTPCLFNPAPLNVGCDARWGAEAAGREAAAL